MSGWLGEWVGWLMVAPLVGGLATREQECASDAWTSVLAIPPLIVFSYLLISFHIFSYLLISLNCTPRYIVMPMVFIISDYTMSELTPQPPDVEVPSSPDSSDSEDIQIPTSICEVQTKMLSLYEEVETLHRRLLALLDMQIKIKKHFLDCQHCRSCRASRKLMREWADESLVTTSSS